MICIWHLIEPTHSVVEHTSRYAVKQTTAVLTPTPHHTVTKLHIQTSTTSQGQLSTSLCSSTNTTVNSWTKNAHHQADTIQVKPTTRFNLAATPRPHRAVEPVSRFTAEPTQHSTIEARRPVPHSNVGSTTHYDFTATPVVDYTVESTNSHTSTHPTVNPLYTDFSDGHLPHTSFSITNTHT